MEILSVPRVIISGVTSGLGRSLIHLGLVHELRRRGISVSCAVHGPQLVQALLLRRLSGRAVRCLDGHILSDGQMLSAAYQMGVGSDLLLIEGRAGLYDGTELGSLRGSDASLSALIHTPVALLVDARGFGSSIGAVMKGLFDSAKDFQLLGCILNYVEPSGEFPKFRDKNYYEDAMRLFNQPKLLGAISHFKHDAVIPGSDFMNASVAQLGAVPSLSRQFFVDLGNQIKNCVDIDELQRRAARAPSVRLPEIDNNPRQRRCRIAVSDDTCFNICTQDNLDLLRYYGAEIVSFSPLADSSLPRKIGAVYLTGGNLDEYGRDVSANASLKNSIKEFAEAGGVVYSEGSGSAFLCRSFRCESDGESLPGVGILPATAAKAKANFSYVETLTAEESILGRPGLIVKGLAANDWTIFEEERVLRCTRISHSGKSPVNEGLSPGAQILATLVHNHFGSAPDVAKNIVDAAEVVQKI